MFVVLESKTEGHFKVHCHYTSSRDFITVSTTAHNPVSRQTHALRAQLYQLMVSIASQ